MESRFGGPVVLGPTGFWEQVGPGMACRRVWAGMEWIVGLIRHGVSNGWERAGLEWIAQFVTMVWQGMEWPVDSDRKGLEWNVRRFGQARTEMGCAFGQARIETVCFGRARSGRSCGGFGPDYGQARMGVVRTVRSGTE